MLVFTTLLAITVGAVLWPTSSNRRVPKVTALMLALFCWTPASMLVVRLAETPYARRPPARGAARAIVVLAGAVHAPRAPVRGPLPASNTYERCRYGAWLALEWGDLPVLLSGGQPPDGDGSWSYAGVMRDLVLQFGVPESRILLEERSRDTHENARYSAAMLSRSGVREIVLVTDAVHMTRASKAFEKLGLTVIPAPCGFRPVYAFALEDLLPSWQALRWNDEVLHEAAGLLWYWARGWV